MVHTLAATAALAPPLHAQDAVRLASACAAGRPGLEAWCAEVVQGFEAVQAGLGLAASGASDIPGSGSTIGRRLGTIPRIAVSGRLGAVYFRAPDIVGAESSAAGVLVDKMLLVPGAQLGATLGLLDGFRLVPTIGGIFSLDLLAAANVVVLPGSQGFESRQVTGYGYGARLGLLRESFTVPGLSVSVVRRSQGEVSLGDVDGGDFAGVRFDLTTTSVRGVVGKNFLVVGLLAGAGYDRYTSDVRLEAASPADRTQRGSASLDDFASERLLFFGGASLSFLVIQLSAEGGWARGLDPVPGRGPSEYDPEGASLFLNVALRLTL